jgi:hypothetical protein
MAAAYAAHPERFICAIPSHPRCQQPCGSTRQPRRWPIISDSWRSSTWRWSVTVGGLLVAAGLLWVVLVLAPCDRDEQEQDEYCETVLEK